jgi:Hint module
MIPSFRLPCKKNTYHHFHPRMITVVVFKLILIVSLEYHTVYSAYCNFALALARSAQPTNCNNIPQCSPNCVETLYAASALCQSSVTYCNPDGSVCGSYGTGGAYSDERPDGFIVTVKLWDLTFTKGYAGTTVQLINGLDTDVSINRMKCEVLVGSCGDNIYIDCTALGHGWYDACTNQYSPGSILYYFFTLDVIDPCNNSVLTPAPISVPRPTSTTTVKPVIPTSPATMSPVAPSTPTPATCFSSSNTVYVKDIGVTPIHQLQIGDMVQSDHIGTYTQVYGFGHYDHGRETDYMQFYMSNSNDIPLEISSLHYVYIKSRQDTTDNDTMNRNDMVTIQASNIMINDTIWNGKQYQKIQSIRYIKRRGVYAPLTQAGYLLVSNVMVSNYVHLLNDHINSYLLWHQHTLGHILFFSYRYYCQFNIKQCQKFRYYEGYSYWSYYVVKIGTHMNQNYHFGWLYALFISCISIPMVLIATIIETSLLLSGVIILCFMILLMMTRLHFTRK